MFEVLKNGEVIFTGTKKACIEFAEVNSSASQPITITYLACPSTQI